jgi:hypothetical protein
MMSAAELDGIVWHKSSYSAANGDCVEVGWRKSSYSAGNGGCVEVAWPRVAGVAVRDSKYAAGPTLAFPVTDWRSFVAKLG